MLSRIKKQQEEAQLTSSQNHAVGNSCMSQGGASGESLAVLRLRKDLDDLDGVNSKIDIPDPSNVLNLKLTVRPPSPSIWHGGIFHFSLEFKEEYPYEGPKVRYTGPHRIWHPNIEGDEYVEGEEAASGKKRTLKEAWGVCLSFQTDWKPIISLRDIIFMIELLFQDPNPDDPLYGTSKEAAQMMKDNPKKFKEKARRWMKGNYS